ncbi:unnamed protein product [Didymodactylos carnosus]|uniref:Uncharacterized protein n=1 Tax=Didymodactylos carnosus TaxID=1234261 RepID=A0A814B092_9BILA|nr:unnamed protein product [Didymodactylos carnosus]CAF1582069.1 unnamed protein product [Didymodactylos carnosus]CAF3701149.1 unnamed protein product [Didymodactylos carnosus]CAF4381887.1 unnamed protein product [Didymodactylos carnosus]
MRGSGSVNSNMITSCVGLPQTITSNRDEYNQNPYVGKDFYEDENYRSALDLLNGGKFLDILLFVTLKNEISKNTYPIMFLKFIQSNIKKVKKV